MLKSRDIIEALNGCTDPELNASIVDLGLIYGIKVSGANDIKITLTMTSPMCPVTSVILADAQLRLEAIKDVGKVEVDLVWEPMWSPEMMSDELKYRE
jgi:metal-sulfur cluster biosynthetic enzyme